MFQAQNRTKNYLKSCCVLQDHYDDERNKSVFHNTTSDLQNQDQDRFFWSHSQTGLVLRPTVSDHVTDRMSAGVGGMDLRCAGMCGMGPKSNSRANQ